MISGTLGRRILGTLTRPVWVEGDRKKAREAPGGSKGVRFLRNRALTHANTKKRPRKMDTIRSSQPPSEPINPSKKRAEDRAEPQKRSKGSIFIQKIKIEVKIEIFNFWLVSKIVKPKKRHRLVGALSSLFNPFSSYKQGNRPKSPDMQKNQNSPKKKTWNARGGKKEYEDNTKQRIMRKLYIDGKKNPKFKPSSKNQNFSYFTNLTVFRC